MMTRPTTAAPARRGERPCALIALERERERKGEKRKTHQMAARWARGAYDTDDKSFEASGSAERRPRVVAPRRRAVSASSTDDAESPVESKRARSACTRRGERE